MSFSLSIKKNVKNVSCYFLGGRGATTFLSAKFKVVIITHFCPFIVILYKIDNMVCSLIVETE